MTAGSMNLNEHNKQHEYDCLLSRFHIKFPPPGQRYVTYCVQRRKKVNVDTTGETQAKSDISLKIHLPFPVGSWPQCLAEGCKC